MSENSKKITISEPGVNQEEDSSTEPSENEEEESGTASSVINIAAITEGILTLLLESALDEIREKDRNMKAYENQQELPADKVPSENDPTNTEFLPKRATDSSVINADDISEADEQISNEQSENSEEERSVEGSVNLEDSGSSEASQYLELDIYFGQFENLEEGRRIEPLVNMQGVVNWDVLQVTTEDNTEGSGDYIRFSDIVPPTQEERPLDCSGDRNLEDIFQRFRNDDEWEMIEDIEEELIDELEFEEEEEEIDEDSSTSEDEINHPENEENLDEEIESADEFLKKEEVENTDESDKEDSKVEEEEKIDVDDIETQDKKDVEDISDIDILNLQQEEMRDEKDESGNINVEYTVEEPNEEIDMMRALLFKKADQIEQKEAACGNNNEDQDAAACTNQFGNLFMFPEVSQESVRGTVRTDDSHLFSWNLAGILQARVMPPKDSARHRREISFLPSVEHKTANEKLYTLVLDIDDTLAHSSFQYMEGADFSLNVSQWETEFFIYVRLRPYLKEFLEKMSNLYEIVTFTASHMCWATPVLNCIDPDGIIKCRLFRKHCCYRGSYNLCKDLTILNRDLSKMVFVDNSPRNFTYQLDNCIPITSFYDDGNDTELRDLIPILEQLVTLDDVRPTIRNLYGLHRIISGLEPEISGNYYEDIRCDLREPPHFCHNRSCERHSRKKRHCSSSRAESTPGDGPSSSGSSSS